MKNVSERMLKTLAFENVENEGAVAETFFRGHLPLTGGGTKGCQSYLLRNICFRSLRTEAGIILMI